MFAAQGGHGAAIAALLAAGAEVEAKDNLGGRAALMLAAGGGHAAAIAALRTALMIAAKGGRAAAIEALVAAGDGVAELGLATGQRVEVSWEVEMTDGTEESVWRGATLSVPDGDSAAGRAMLLYDESHGYSKETRWVLFTSASVLWDSVLAG